MPKIKSFAPSWLNEPSPGHKLFEPSTDDVRIPATPYGKKPKPGPRRTITHRGTEIFVAVGKQIRWGDLTYLKDSWETKQAHSSPGTRIKRETPDDSFDYGVATGGNGAGGYRVSAIAGLNAGRCTNVSQTRPSRRPWPMISAS
jgi:nucleoporin NUP82